MLFGRTAERARIESLFTDARGGQSASLVVRGDPGAGKTALIADAASGAPDLLQLRAFGTLAETEFAFSGLQELLRSILGLLDRIPVVQADALRGALALAETRGVGRLYVGAAVLSLLAAAADDGPVLCVVDDAQWLDQASADALTFAARRLEAEGVVMLFAAQDGAASTFEAAGIAELRLSGLDRAASLELLAAAEHPIADPVAAGLVEATGGNPLALVEIPPLLTDAQRLGRDPLPRPLPVGPELTAAFADRTRGLSDGARQALLLAAASDTGSMRVIARAPVAAGSALEECEAAGLVAFGEGRYEFAHPLLRAAVYRSAPPADRRAAHRAVADALTDEPGYAERRAWHVAASTMEPNERVAAELADAARGAGDRRAYVTEAALYERAARFTPDPSIRSMRLVSAAGAAWRAGQAERVVSLLALADDGIDDPRVRADANLLAMQVARARGSEQPPLQTLLDIAESVAEIDPSRAAEMLAVGAETPGADGPALIRRAEALVVGSGGRAELLVCLAAARSQGRARRSAERSLERARQIMDGDSALGRDPEVVLRMIDVLGEGELDEALTDELLERAAEAARGHTLVALPRALVHQAWRSVARGDLQDAYVTADEALRLFDETGQLARVATAEALLATLDALRGRETECRDRLAHLRQLPGWSAQEIQAVEGRVLGTMALGSGDATEAVRRLEPVADAPGTLLPGRAILLAQLVDALVRCDDHEAAQRFAAEIDVRGELLGPLCKAWCEALLADDGGERSFARAFAVLDKLPSDRPFLRARVHLSHGERLRRAGERTRSRTELRAAFDLFDAMGAAPWAERCRTELAATGQKVRRRDPSAVDELTPQELHVAQVIAEGATYKEAAARLFLSPKTIEFHLGKVYRKLGIRSGRELLAALTREPDEEAS